MSDIWVESLRKEYSVASGTEVAVDDVSFSIGDDEFLTLVGPSGCGKTTTLRCIAGLETPTFGEIRFDGEDVSDIPAYKRNISMMFQNIALYPHMKVWKNISYPLKIRGVSTDEQYEKALESSKTVKLSEDLLDKYPGELSGGQRQRAALARTIVQEPYAFLMDEPLSDLDAKLKVEIRREIQHIHSRLDQPTLYVTHDQEEALTMSDRIAVMNDGNIEHIGTREEVYHYPKNTFVANFIGNPSMNFLDATLLDMDEETGHVDIDGHEFEFDIDEILEEPSNSAVIVGVRPHDVVVRNEIDGDEGIVGRLDLIEPIDDRALATIHFADQEIMAVIPSENVLDEEASVAVTFDPSGFYIFDEESDELVARAAYSTDQVRESPTPGQAESRT